MGCSQVACAIEGWWTGQDHHHRKLLSLPHVIIIYDLCLKKGRVHFTSNHQQSLCNRAATPAPNVRVRHYSEQLGAVSAARSLIKSDLRVARLASARGVLFVFFHFISRVTKCKCVSDTSLWHVRNTQNAFSPSIFVWSLQFTIFSNRERPRTHPCIYNPLSDVPSLFSALFLNYSAWYAILNSHLCTVHTRICIFLYFSTQKPH
jgi:hypothetical protein